MSKSLPTRADACAAVRETVGRCQWAHGCDRDAARVVSGSHRATPRGLEPYCKLHRDALRISPRARRDNGFDDDQIGYPSRAATAVAPPPVAPPAPAPVHVLTFEIAGEAVTIDQLVNLWIAVRAATRAA